MDTSYARRVWVLELVISALFGRLAPRWLVTGWLLVGGLLLVVLAVGGNL